MFPKPIGSYSPRRRAGLSGYEARSSPYRSLIESSLFGSDSLHSYWQAVYPPGSWLSYSPMMDFPITTEPYHRPDATKFLSRQLPTPASVERPKQHPCLGLSTVRPTPREDSAANRPPHLLPHSRPSRQTPHAKACLSRPAQTGGRTALSSRTWRLDLPKQT